VGFKVVCLPSAIANDWNINSSVEAFIDQQKGAVLESNSVTDIEPCLLLPALILVADEFDVTVSGQQLATERDRESAHRPACSAVEQPAYVLRLLHPIHGAHALSGYDTSLCQCLQAGSIQKRTSSQIQGLLSQLAAY
jgi:hypothetical protein